jgi:hypothetical protein
MSEKSHPERVIVPLVVKAMETGKDRASLFSEYIRLHYHATGNLAPGCDAKDFYAVIDSLTQEKDKEDI